MHVVHAEADGRPHAPHAGGVVVAADHDPAGEGSSGRGRRRLARRAQHRRRVGVRGRPLRALLHRAVVGRHGELEVVVGHAAVDADGGGGVARGNAVHAGFEAAASGRCRPGAHRCRAQGVV